MKKPYWKEVERKKKLVLKMHKAKYSFKQIMEATGYKSPYSITKIINKSK